MKENPWEQPKGKATDDCGIISLFEQILSYQATKQVRDLSSAFVTFMRAAEADLPHGMCPGHFQPTGQGAWNVAQREVAHLRTLMRHETRDRSSRMAGWT